MRYEMTTGNRMGGLIKPPQPFAIGGYKTGLSADYLLLTLVNVAHSLRDLCETEVNAASQPVERRDSQGHPLWDFHFKAQPGFPAWDVRHEMPDGKYYSYVLTLSPRHGYAIIESDRITRVNKSEKGTQEDLVIHDRRLVLEFQEPAPVSSCPGGSEWRGPGPTRQTTRNTWAKPSSTTSRSTAPSPTRNSPSGSPGGSAFSMWRRKSFTSGETGLRKGRSRPMSTTN